MSTEIDELIENKLLEILKEMEKQTHLSVHYSEESLSFEEEIEQIREFIQDAGEYSVAYEALIVNLEEVPFVIPSKLAIDFLEVGLLMNYKTDREIDKLFDQRS